MSIMHHFCTHSAPIQGLGKGALTRLLLGFLSSDNPNCCTITDRGYSDTVLDVLALFSGVGRMICFKSCSSSIL